MISYIEQCAKLIKDANNIAVLTGAGMSTESGIPDFRSRTGIYKDKFQNINPEEILSLSFFYRNPKLFWEFMKSYMNWSNAKPNIGHEILAKWEQHGKDITIITQNIDRLHTAASSKKIIEVHGTVKTATCQNLKCRKSYEFEDIIGREDGYVCTCGELIKPDVVLFEEQVDKMSQVYPVLEKSDLLIILGTSLNVYPVAHIPEMFDTRNKSTIIINKTPTPYGNKHNFIEINHSIGDTLEEIDKLL